VRTDCAADEWEAKNNNPAIIKYRNGTPRQGARRRAQPAARTEDPMSIPDCFARLYVKEPLHPKLYAVPLEALPFWWCLGHFDPDAPADLRFSAALALEHWWSIAKDSCPRTTTLPPELALDPRLAGWRAQFEFAAEMAREAVAKVTTFTVEDIVSLVNRMQEDGGFVMRAHTSPEF
jgi:hypothetical protein